MTESKISIHAASMTSVLNHIVNRNFHLVKGVAYLTNSWVVDKLDLDNNMKYIETYIPYRLGWTYQKINRIIWEVSYKVQVIRLVTANNTMHKWFFKVIKDTAVIFLFFSYQNLYFEQKIMIILLK